MTQSIEFKGVVDTLKFRNPHMAMTLTHLKADGSKETINFVEGAPANMLVRMGLDPGGHRAGPGNHRNRRAAPRRSDLVLLEGDHPQGRNEVRQRRQLTTDST